MRRCRRGKKDEGNGGVKAENEKREGRYTEKQEIKIEGRVEEVKGRMDGKGK